MPEIPFALKWSIPEDRLLPLKHSIDGCLLSTTIRNIPEFEYYIKFYPNADRDEFRGQTMIFLYIVVKTVKPIEADFTFTVESANFSLTEHYICEESNGWGNVICKTDELFDPENKFIVDRKLTVKVNGTFKFKNEGVSDHVIEQKLAGGNLGDELWRNDETKDFTIITKDGKEIKVHKLVLGIQSEVFAAMLNSNMKEAVENMVEIPEFSFNVVEAALKIIYNCNFTFSLSIEELMLLLQFFDKYQLPALKEIVELFLIPQISITNVCRLTNASVLTNSFQLKEKCMDFLMGCFKSKTPLNDFQILDKDIVFEIVQNSFYQIVETQK